MEKMEKDKRLLRKQMKILRDQIPADERMYKSRQMAAHLVWQPWYGNSEAILVYSAIQSEADLSFFCNMAWKNGKKLFFPRVSGETMEFYRTDSSGQLEPGSFGVMEPKIQQDAGNIWQPNCSSNLKVPILVPGVAFSACGQRIGYGKGYYDKYLSQHPELMPIGICFELQMVEAIEVDAFDCPMEQILTEYRYWKTASQ